MFEEWGEQMNEEWEDFTKDSKKAMKKIKDTLGDVVDDHKNIIVVSAVGVAAVIVGVILIVALLGYGISKLFDDQITKEDDLLTLQNLVMDKQMYGIQYRLLIYIIVFTFFSWIFEKQVCFCINLII